MQKNKKTKNKKQTKKEITPSYGCHGNGGQIRY